MKEVLATYYWETWIIIYLAVIAVLLRRYRK